MGGYRKHETDQGQGFAIHDTERTLQDRYLHVRGSQEYLAAICGCVGRQVEACVLVNQLVAKLQNQRGTCAYWAVKANGKLVVGIHIAVADEMPYTGRAPAHDSCQALYWRVAPI